MGVLAAAYRKMVASGMSSDDIAEMLEIIEWGAPTAALPAALEKRRAYDRERKRAKKASVSTGIPPEKRNSAEKVLSETKGFPRPLLKTQPISNTPSPPLGGAHGSSFGDEIGQALMAYNDVAAEIGLPAARTLTADRRRHLKARLAEHGLEGWRAAMIGLKAPFCNGDNDRGWRANLDFALQAKSCAKLVEDAYSGSRQRAPSAPAMSFAMMDAVNEELGVRLAREAINARRNGDLGRDQGVVIALPRQEISAEGPRQMAAGFRDRS